MFLGTQLMYQCGVEKESWAVVEFENWEGTLINLRNGTDGQN